MYLLDDMPFSDWCSILTFSGPQEPGLIHVRATQNGTPVAIEYPKATDTSGTLYIKACDNIDVFTRWLCTCLLDPNAAPMHPGAEVFHSTENAQELWPIDGLQVRYITNEQVSAAEVVVNIQYKAPEPQTPRYDELIRETCDIRDWESSGYWIPDQTRDIQFRFPTRNMAKAAIKALKKHPDLQNIELTCEIQNSGN